MPDALTTIGFDADDTLWENEQFFRMTQQRFADLLKEEAPPEQLGERLMAAQRRNMSIYGFGVKGFVLSMIETAIDVTGGRVPAADIDVLLKLGRDMLNHPIEPLPHARDALEAIAGRYRVVLITKGDLLDQERKLAQSGLGDYFDAVEIVSDKTRDIYERVFSRRGEGPRNAMMVGNSMKSDVLPAVAAGSWGVYVPHGATWEWEHGEPPEGHDRYRELPDLGRLPDLIAEIARN